MNNKALNLVIFGLVCAILSVVLSTASLALIPKSQPFWILCLDLLSTLADLGLTIMLYRAIKAFFPEQSLISIATAGIAVFILMPLWFGFKIFVFEGSFNLSLPINSLYLNLFDNLLHKLIDPSVTYFTKTLFAESLVTEHFFTYVLTLLTDLTHFIVIPLIPFILMFQNILRGTEVYQFSSFEEETHEPQL